MCYLKVERLFSLFRALHNYKYILSLFNIILLVAGPASLPVLAIPVPQPSGSGGPPQVSAPAAVLMDATTGKLLYAKNPDLRKAPASTTKILTALIALEKGHLNDRITVGHNPPRVEGTRVYLVEGEKVSLENLLYGLLLNSGNDAALAIAEHYGGSQQGFARLMNRKAVALGARNSHFISPNGLSDPGHYTTARDLAIITRAAMQNPTFRQIVATRTRPWAGQAWQTTLVNQNRMLWKYAGANGVKTGYTREARNTLVASATRHGQTFIAVVLEESTGRAAESDAAALLDYGFQNFRALTLARKGQVMAVIPSPGEKNIGLVAARDLAVTGKVNDVPPTAEVHLSPLKGPLPAGTPAGEVVFKYKGKTAGKVDILTGQPLAAPPLTLADWWLRLSLSAAAVCLLVWITKRVRRPKNRRRLTVKPMK